MTEQTTFSTLYTLVDELKHANAQGQLEQCNELLGKVQDFIDEHGDELRSGSDYPVLKRALEMRVLIWPARDIVSLLDGKYEDINRNRSLTITRDVDGRYWFTLNQAARTVPQDGQTSQFRPSFRGRGAPNTRGGFGNRSQPQRQGQGQNTRSTYTRPSPPNVYIPQAAWADQ
jgi:hypothetical protein